MLSGNNISSFGLRPEKETLLKQHARVFWMCGLSGAGKSTLAGILDKNLTRMGYLCQVIDGDVVREGLNKGLGFSVEDRCENLRRVAEVAKMFCGCGIISIVSFISPTRSIRQMAREIIGKNDFMEIYINSPLDICEKRDIKGLYKQAREGRLKNFTGIDSPFEPPENPDLNLDTCNLTIEKSAQLLLDFVLPWIAYK